MIRYTDGSTSTKYVRVGITLFQSVPNPKVSVCPTCNLKRLPYRTVAYDLTFLDLVAAQLIEPQLCR